MTLLELDERVTYIQETQREKRKWHLSDLSKVIYYGCYYGHVVPRNNKVKEADFHTTIDKILTTKITKDTATSPEDALSVFG